MFTGTTTYGQTQMMTHIIHHSYHWFCFLWFLVIVGSWPLLTISLTRIHQYNHSPWGKHIIRWIIFQASMAVMRQLGSNITSQIDGRKAALPGVQASKVVTNGFKQWWLIKVVTNDYSTYWVYQGYQFLARWLPMVISPGCFHGYASSFMMINGGYEPWIMGK